ncbi:rod shape-determining protein MreD [Saccharophagus degradans]|uniref:Rod shape-determining protein MreD n=1 Tax=Saccharophagus degradans TaxID=86304 RepID=A0AAW7X139_9GAMM|nr:rod shape-determining protein MreD [Saccharophagus degradans]MBU2985359.1 rod shape-determining protein MreD [Saccharophagus degradans]MDO6421440.1 rod shape-determining protein MreD [Saccharophagus degradans]MDO6608746.1 rod shape-determining protein MreD [Saccharophagus degradans]
MPNLGLSFYIFFCVSAFFALVLSIYPIPHAYAALRPELFCLLVVYWVINYPQYFGVTTAWLMGLFLDVVHSTVWGAHALGLAAVAYICLSSYQRIRSYSLWQQTLWVFVFVGIHQVIVNWMLGLSGYHKPTHIILVTTAVSALSWPIMVLLFRRLRRHYRLL